MSTVVAYICTAGRMSAASFVKDFGAESIGAKMGGQLMDAIMGPLVHVNDGGGHSHLERMGGKGFLAIGKAIGDAVAQGFVTALGTAGTKAFTDWLWSIEKAIVGTGVGSGGVGPKGGVSGAKASGGPVSAYGDYLVGEQGPEILRMGPQAGTVIPHGAGSDMSETNRLLREQNELLRASLGGSGSGTGTNAILNTLFESVSRSRRRGIAGAV